MANRETTCNLLASATGKPVEVIKKDCSRVRYLQPAEAVEYGLVDKVLESTSELPVETPAFMSKM